MGSFTPLARTFRGRVVAKGSVGEVFPLFSPEGERRWVPGWEPEMLHPAEGWEEGQIFRTREESGEAVWIVTRLDPARHEAEYHRVEPGHSVARIRVRCRATDDRGSEASIEYAYVGLSEAGNRSICAMTQADYDAKMSRWTEWIARDTERA